MDIPQEIKALNDLVAATVEKAFADGKEAGRREMREELLSKLGFTLPKPVEIAEKKIGSESLTNLEMVKKPRGRAPVHISDPALEKHIIDVLDDSDVPMVPGDIVVALTEKNLAYATEDVRLALRQLMLTGKLARTTDGYELSSEMKAAE